MYKQIQLKAKYLFVQYQFERNLEILIILIHHQYVFIDDVRISTHFLNAQILLIRELEINNRPYYWRGFLFVFGRAAIGAYKLCNYCRTIEDGQKDQQDWMIIFFPSPLGRLFLLISNGSPFSC